MFLPHINICKVSDMRMRLPRPAFGGKGRSLFSHSSVSLPACIPETGVYF